MTVEELLERMTLAEFLHWAEHFSSKSRGKQSAAEIRANLAIAFAARRAKVK
jgi:hypothetical protein